MDRIIIIEFIRFFATLPLILSLYFSPKTAAKTISKSAIMTIPGGNIIASINFFMKNIDIDLSY